ncbi:hypothetical protein [Glaesserella parasuis]
MSLGAFPSVSLKEAREIRDLYRSIALYWQKMSIR